MQVESAVNQTVINPFVAGRFDYDQLRLPVTPEEVTLDSDVDPEELAELYPYLTEAEQHELDALLAADDETLPLLPHQIVPWWRDDWEIFALEGGRGVGKTLTLSNATMEHIHGVGKRARCGLAAPTNTDVRDVVMEGETGLMTLFGHEFTHYARSLGQIEARHKNGAFVRAMGTEKPERWNGPQWSFFGCDEFALCNRVAIMDVFLGLRLGPKNGPYRARAVLTFTPKGMKWVRDYTSRPDTYMPYYIDVSTGQPRRPTTFDNPYLPERRVALLKRELEGTRLGMRELLAIEQLGVLGAQWNPDIITHVTDHQKWPRFVRVVVSVDPAGTKAREKADENAASEAERKEGRKRAATAICVKAKGVDGKIYTLAWVAGRWSPNVWAMKAVELFRRFRADRIVVERNYGGDMVENTIRNVWADAPISEVVATRGKEVRAQPVVALYEQGREIHCRVFAEAEHQLCNFIDTDHNEGADYVDSGVWATWELMGFSFDRVGMAIVGHHQELEMFAVR